MVLHEMDIVPQHRALWVQLIAECNVCGLGVSSISIIERVHHQNLVIIQGRHRALQTLTVFRVFPVAAISTLNVVEHREIDNVSHIHLTLGDTTLI